MKFTDLRLKLWSSKYKNRKKGNVRSRGGMERIFFRLSMKYSGRFGMKVDNKVIIANWFLLRREKVCHGVKECKSGSVLDLTFGKFHFWVKRLKTEISAHSEKHQIVSWLFQPLCVSFR